MNQKHKSEKMIEGHSSKKKKGWWARFLERMAKANSESTCRN